MKAAWNLTVMIILCVISALVLLSLNPIKFTKHELLARHSEKTEPKESRGHATTVDVADFSSERLVFALNPFAGFPDKPRPESQATPSSQPQNRMSSGGSEIPAPASKRSTRVQQLIAQAEQGDADSAYNLGKRYWIGEGVDQDYSEALAWFALAADLGHARAPFGVGRCYQEGKGVALDAGEAAEWYREGAERGDQRAGQGLAGSGPQRAAGSLQGSARSRRTDARGGTAVEGHRAAGAERIGHRHSEAASGPW